MTRSTNIRQAAADHCVGRPVGAWSRSDGARIQALARADAILSAVLASKDGNFARQRVEQRPRSQPGRRSSIWRRAWWPWRRMRRATGSGLRNIELGRLGCGRRCDLLAKCRPAPGPTPATYWWSPVPYLSNAIIVERRATAYVQQAPGRPSTRLAARRCWPSSTAMSGARIHENVRLSAATEHTDHLLEGLGRVARRGYALEVEENELGAFCVARAISNSFDEAPASISVASVTQRMSEEVVARFAAVLEEEVGKWELQLAGEGVGAITQQARAAGSRPRPQAKGTPARRAARRNRA